MILLDGHTLTPKTYFTPEAMSLNIEERNSSATMTLGPDAPELTVKDWVQDNTEPGKGIVWRVKSVTETIETKTRTVTLEHVVQCLKDQVMFGEVTAAMMGGGENCTARQAAQYVMGRQGEWRIGDVAENPSNPYHFNGDNLYSALEEITSSIEDAQWEYDLSSMPFTLHIRKPPAGYQSEMRMSRNITTLRRQIDRSRMYTRIYPIGKNNMHISGDYLSKNEGIWGTVCKVETDQSRESESALRTWAWSRLSRHCEPLVTITISGLDFSRSTGESLDKVTVCRRCQVPLPDYGTVITEKVTKLSWGNKIREPEKFTVTLANNREDVASIVNQLNKTAGSGGSGGRASAKQKEEDHAWFEDTTEHVAMVAEAVAGEGADKDWSRVASVMVDGNGIHQRVTRTEKDIVTAFAEIEVAEDKIDMKVSRDNLISEINMSPESIKIKASKINLEGYVTASDLRAINAKIDNLTTGVTTANALKARAVYASMGFTYQGHAVSFRTVTVGSNEYHLLGY